VADTKAALFAFLPFFRRHFSSEGAAIMNMEDFSVSSGKPAKGGVTQHFIFVSAAREFIGEDICKYIIFIALIRK